MTFEQYMRQARKEAIRALDRNDAIIRRTYAKLEREVLDQLAVSPSSKESWKIKQILKGLREASKATTGEVKSLMDKSLLEAAGIKTDATEKGLKPYIRYMNRAGLPEVKPGKLLFRVPEEAIKVIYDRTYKDGLHLSERIWKLNMNTQRGLSSIIREALAKGVPYDDPKVTEQISRFLQPARRGVQLKPSVTRKLKDGTEFTFRQRPVSYDAARLLRTETMNAFREADLQCAMRNPACYGELWTLSTEHPDIGCECEEYAEHDEGLGSGVFSIENVPITPHPQCLCDTSAVTIGFNEFMDWVDDYKSGADNKISQWWNDYGYKLAA
jgi:hypothetical protein